MRLLIMMSLLLVSLISLSGCCKGKALKPKQYEVSILGECKGETIIPNKDSSLNAINHRRLLRYTKCYKNQALSYKKQLINIRDNQKVEQ